MVSPTRNLIYRIFFCLSWCKIIPLRLFLNQGIDMTIRQLISSLASNLIHIPEPASRNYEIATILKSLEPHPVLFENETETHRKVIGNLYCQKNAIAQALEIPVSQLRDSLFNAINHPTPQIGRAHV